MNLYIYGIGILVITVLLYINHNLSQTVEYQDDQIASLHASLSMAKQDYKSKLSAIDEKTKFEQQIKTNFEIKRKGCETDEKAISIINIGVPLCLLQAPVY